jgi:hypothetical protein
MTNVQSGIRAGVGAPVSIRAGQGKPLSEQDLLKK